MAGEKNSGKTGKAAWERLKAQTTPLDKTHKNRHIEPPAAARAAGKSLPPEPISPASKPARSAHSSAPSSAHSSAPSSAHSSAHSQTKGPEMMAAREKPPPRPGLAQKAKRRLSRGAVEIGGRLDLHGMSVAQAHRSLIGFVSAAVAQEKKWLLVITGKGERGEGKLRRALPDWLASAPLADQIAEYGPSAPNHGGDGAFYLRLRRRAKP